jgi:hypothetical protein
MKIIIYFLRSFICTVPKTRQILDSVGEKVSRRGNFPVIRENYASSPRTTKKFLLHGALSPLHTEISQIFIQ